MANNRYSANPVGFSWRRLFALCRKETYQIIRDPSSSLIAFLIPIMLLFIFGYGINLDSSKIRLGILMEQQNNEARHFVDAFIGSPFIEPTIGTNRNELIQKLQAGEIRGMVVIPVDFAQKLNSESETAAIQVITDGSEPNTANFVQGFTQGAWQVWQRNQMQDKGIIANQLIELETRYWFNPAAISRNFIIPGAITIIMTVIGAILTSLVIAREREQGTLDQLLVSPLTTGQIFFGKAIPAMLIAIFQGTIILLVGIFFYRIPFAGSFPLFYGSMVFYSLSLVGFGLLISSLCATQQQAFIGVFVFMMPAILLSGYISPVENMPIWLQNITWINPIRHFTDITKQLYLKDADFSVISGSLTALLVITLSTGSIAYLMFRRKIA